MLQYTMNLSIELDDLTLNFTVADTPVANLWTERMALRDPYPLDHPDRFYGFNSLEQEESHALKLIQASIDTINNYRPVITRQITTVADQDTLNYLHNVFEQYHGLLDQQSREFFKTAPPEVKVALADLNINVHRCEAVARGNSPRFICTWYGLPKTETLSDDLLKYGTLDPKFGSVCLNYCEIGKTLEDLTQDRDNYISDEAFKTFDHYSADFNVRFYEESQQELENKLFNMRSYFNEHIKFFHSKGYNSYHDSRLQPYRFPVAQLIETMPRQQLLKEIQQRQRVTKVALA
jgi:hypothetical protein